jgi:NAD(P)-dependent dehydrogenase (short-subunit alcohol dehydrogenase family)
METIKNKNLVAIVTGASQGIGRAVAEHFLKKQFKVIAADINENPEVKWWENHDLKSNLLFIKTDVGDESDVKKMINLSVENFGDNINVLVNNAGISNPYQWGKTLEDLSYEEWNKYISTNLNSVFLCSKYAIPYMKSPINGSIINISSTRALMSEPNGEAYNTTKGGMISLTHAIAISYGKHKIRSNCIVPGWIHTSKHVLNENDHAQHPIGIV